MNNSVLLCLLACVGSVHAAYKKTIRQRAQQGMERTPGNRKTFLPFALLPSWIVVWTGPAFEAATGASLPHPAHPLEDTEPEEEEEDGQDLFVRALRSSDNKEDDENDDNDDEGTE